jgi:PucR family transcriptional regulator, purine catabolism regulatory protein
LRSYITVRDILQRKHFENVEIMAGEEGLNRLVKWVHVVDVTNIRNLLNGGELILSTGVAWKEKKEVFISLVEQLIESGAAGLCIEIGTYTSSIPEEIMDIANIHQFPLMCFHREVPFVEITQDIHTLLINHQYQMISALENYSQLLNKKLLTMKHHMEILTFIHQYLKIQVILVMNKQEIQFVPKVTEIQRKNLIDKMEEHRTNPSPSIAKVPIQLLGEQYAELIIISNERSLNEFDQLILDRTGIALAQFLIRELYVQEKRKVEEVEWLKMWLDGEQSREQIQEYLSFHLPTVPVKGAVVCQCRLDPFGKYSNLDLTYFKLYFRTIMEQQGFSLFAIEQRYTLIFIIINNRSASTWMERMKEGLRKLADCDFQGGKQKFKPIIGVGKYVEDLTTIHISYQTSVETIQIQNGRLDHFEGYFYDDLHIFRLISLLNRHIDLHEIVLEYLEPVINYDKKYNGKLMETLKTYLACNGSKQETAKQLYIVRQTLYHRLQKLEKLLGDDFMNQEKRLAIEFMIHSYDFLISAKDKKTLQIETS